MDDDIRMRVKMELPFLVRVLASDAVEKAVEFMGKFGVKRREVRYIMALYETFEAIKSFFMGDNGKENIINTKAKPLAERWITISACRSDQVNFEMKKPAVGKLTYALWTEQKKSEKVSNEEFIRRIRKFVNCNTTSRLQQPEMTGEDIGKYNITDILNK